MSTNSFPEFGTLPAPATFDELASLSEALIAVHGMERNSAARLVLLLVGYDRRAALTGCVWRALDMALDRVYYTHLTPDDLQQCEKEATGAAEAYAKWRAGVRRMEGRA